MKRSVPLLWQVFLSILTVSLLSVFATGLIVRSVFSASFETYLGAMSEYSRGPGQGGGGRALLGTAEQTFLSAVDRGILITSLIALAVAVLVAFLLARYLTRSLASLSKGARELASGQLDYRVDVDGSSEIMDLADAFNEMADSLSEVELLRQRMVADVAHELRNPIASLRAQTEGIAEGVLDLDDARAQSLVDDVTHLSRLVEDLQELSIAEAGRLRYEPHTFDLLRLIDTELERARVHAADGVELTRSTSTPVSVHADEFRIGQVLRNLLMNAVRHTKVGAVTVSARLRGDAVRVKVCDTGSGIPEADLPYIFERFYRADSSRGAATGGAGIGLAISERIIKDHGGAIYADSLLGTGTTIEFEIPLGGADSSLRG